MFSTPIKDFDLAFIDAEMTGREPQHELIEIAVLRANSFNFEIIDEWEVKIKPQNLGNADPESLEVCGYSDAAWHTAMDPKEAMEIFLKKTNKTILVGHALNNDWFYITKTLAEHKLTPSFFFKGLDTFSLAWQKLRHDPLIKLISLKELARYYDIEQNNPHRALSDARTTYQIFKKLIT